MVPIVRTFFNFNHELDLVRNPVAMRFDPETHIFESILEMMARERISLLCKPYFMNRCIRESNGRFCVVFFHTYGLGEKCE